MSDNLNNSRNLKLKPRSIMPEIDSQPAATGTGIDVRTNVFYAVASLKSKSPAWIPAQTLIADNIRAPEQTPEMLTRFRVYMKAHHKVTYNKASDSFKFRPIHDIFTADDLIRHLQSQTTAEGLGVRDLKDGWNDVEKTIDELEKEKKLVVVRNKKENSPKWVWADDPTLCSKVDAEFVKLWEGITMPDHKAIVEALKRRGMSAADPEALAPKVIRKEKPKKKSTRQSKVTNTHMKGILKDYSHRRK